MSNKKIFPNSNFGLIMRKLYDLASEGIIMLELLEFEKYIIEESKKKINPDDFAEGIEEGINRDMVIITRRQICSNQLHALFYCNKIYYSNTYFWYSMILRDIL